MILPKIIKIFVYPKGKRGKLFTKKKDTASHEAVSQQNNKTINKRLDEIKLFGDDFLLYKKKYKDIQTKAYKSFRVYDTDLSISILNHNGIHHYFIDFTYK